MKIFPILPAALLITLALGSSLIAVAQEKTSGNRETNDEIESKKDPFGAAENPFDERPKNESVEQKNLRILESQSESLKYEKKLNLKLREEVESVSAKSRQLVALVFESIETMFRAKDPSIQIDGVRLLDSTIQTVLTSEDEQKLVSRTFHASLKTFVESENLELRTAVIWLFERNLCDSGIRLGYQPIGGLWQPINDSTRDSNSVRSRMENSTDLQFFDDSLTVVLETIEDFAAVEFDHQHDVDLDSLTLELDLKKTTFMEILENALQKAKLGYVIQKGKIVVLPLDSDKLRVTRVFNVRGLLTTEMDVADLIKLINVGMADSKLKSITSVDENRIMLVGTEQQVRKVMVTLGQLASSGQSAK